MLYSNQVESDRRVDAALCRFMEAGGRIGYVPSGPDPERVFVRDRETYYARYGWEVAVVYDLDVEHNAGHRDRLLACDAIHLSGGDTLAFLSRLKRAGMLDVLHDWAQAGGLLIGVSAGAMLMTPSVAAEHLFQGKRPDSTPEQDAMSLVPFEFFPHAQDARLFDELLAYSRNSPRPIAACADGEGIVVTGSGLECIGKVRWLVGGAVRDGVPASFADVEVLSMAS